MNTKKVSIGLPFPQQEKYICLFAQMILQPKYRTGVCHFFFLFLYILKFVSFLLENEYGRLKTHSLFINSDPNYSNIAYFRSY